MTKDICAAGNCNDITARATEFERPEVTERHEEIRHGSLTRKVARATRAVGGGLVCRSMLIEEQGLIRHGHGRQDAQHLVLHFRRVFLVPTQRHDEVCVATRKDDFEKAMGRATGRTATCLHRIAIPERLTHCPRP